MKNKKYLSVFILFCIFIFITQCKKEPVPVPVVNTNGWVYDPQPYTIPKPLGLPPFPFSLENPETVQGVALGRKLFYDPILSADSTLSCSGCHNQQFGFTDSGKQYSIGIDGIYGNRNAMPIFNLAYVPTTPAIGFFWDGRATSLVDQALQPIQNVIEMHNTLPVVVSRLQQSEEYKKMFYEAFGDSIITDGMIANAIAQFDRIIISGASKFDSVINAIPGKYFTEQELDGYNLFIDPNGGDCFHCHTAGGMFTDYLFRNNGIDSVAYYTDFADAGFGAVSGDTLDYGKFKTPSLRNIALTAPYMHDGRFATLDDVLNYYSAQVHAGAFTDHFMQFAFQGGVQLTDYEKQAIISFLKTLTDSSYINNPAYGDPKNDLSVSKLN